MKDSKITINLLPQSPDAWWAIAACVLFISGAVAFSSMAGCTAREAEARHAVEVKPAR